MGKIIINESQLKKIVNNIILEERKYNINEELDTQQARTLIPKIKQMLVKINNSKTEIMKCLTKYPNLKRMADMSWNYFGIVFGLFLVAGSGGLLYPVIGIISLGLNIPKAHDAYKDTDFKKLAPEFDKLKKCLGNI
jgi:hypothetical protein